MLAHAFLCYGLKMDNSIGIVRHLPFPMLGNFACFCRLLMFFFKINFFEKKSTRVSICRVFPDAQNPVFWHIFNRNDPPKINQCVLSEAIKKKRTLFYVSSNKTYQTDFLWLIIARFINNLPIATCVLHQTHRHQCLLEYLLGRKNTTV